MQMPQMAQMPQFPMMQSPVGQMAPIGEIVWVQSIDQLGALNLPPNVSRLYMNSAEAEFYIVTTDKIGMKNIVTYTFAEKPKQAPMEYVTKAELDSFKADLISALREARNEPNTQCRSKDTSGWRSGDYKAKADSRGYSANDSESKSSGD